MQFPQNKCRMCCECQIKIKMSKLITSKSTILPGNHKIVYVIINHKPKWKHPKSNKETTKDINQTVHAKIDSSYKVEQNFCLCVGQLFNKGSR